MKNEVYIVLFIYLMVNPTVFANLCFRRSNRLTKKTYYYATGASAVNYCGGGQQRGAKKKISLQPYVPPNNKVLLDYKDSIIYPDEEQLEAERKLEQLEREQKNQENKETINDKKIKAKKKTSVKKGPINKNQKGGVPQKGGAPQRGAPQRGAGNQAKKNNNSNQRNAGGKNNQPVRGRRNNNRNQGNAGGKNNKPAAGRRNNNRNQGNAGGKNNHQNRGKNNNVRNQRNAGGNNNGNRNQRNARGNNNNKNQPNANGRNNINNQQGANGGRNNRNLNNNGPSPQNNNNLPPSPQNNNNLPPSPPNNNNLPPSPPNNNHSPPSPQNNNNSPPSPQNNNNSPPSPPNNNNSPPSPSGQNGQQGEDALNPNKFMDAPGNIPQNIAGKNFITLNQPGVDKLLKVITPQRWKKDHSKEKKECFSDLPTYNQGSCGSCFVFAGVSFFSVFRCMGTGNFVSYSHQDMVNCTPPATKLGSRDNCQGGLPKYVWEYMAQNGILEQSCQCYESHDGKVKQCNRNACKNGGQPKLTKPETKEVMHMRSINMVAYAIEYIGPLMAGISINAQNVAALNNFNQGIQGKVKYDLNKLFGGVAASGQHAGHAVVIVGYRVRTDKQECRGQGLIDPAKKDFKRSCVHIKIMNSWAGDWGRQGYAWLPSEMLDWAEVAFPTQKQMDAFSQLVGSGDIQGSVVKFTKKKYRLSWEK